MTVSELITELQKIPQDTLILIEYQVWTGWGDKYVFGEEYVSEVKLDCDEVVLS